MSAGFDVSVVALYLPQYHPVPANDEFWGPGFTEWRSTVAGVPRFPGHRQPRRPGALGFYDLRVPETRAAQAELARRGAVDAFVYYHYWFSGRRELHRPLDDIIRLGEPDFPFAICWANHDWNRWQNGQPDEVLITQTHSAEDDRHHADFLASLMADPRYHRVEGRPLFMMYRSQTHPDIRRFVGELRRAAADRGLPNPYLVRFETNDSELDPAVHGFDAAAEIHPHWLWHADPAQRPPTLPIGFEDDWFCDYEEVARFTLERPAPPWVRHACVVPDWDTSARRPLRAAWGLVGTSPERYGAWLQGAIEQQVRRYPTGPKLVVVNAWNEWSEGSYLEPDLEFGDDYLAATRRARERAGTSQPLQRPAGRRRGVTSNVAQLVRRITNGGSRA